MYSTINLDKILNRLVKLYMLKDFCDFQAGRAVL